MVNYPKTCASRYQHISTRVLFKKLQPEKKKHHSSVRVYTNMSGEVIVLRDGFNFL